jgi:hypothetical protein
MIVSTMTYNELEKEVHADYEELNDFAQSKVKVYTKKYKNKFKNLPLFKKSSHFEAEIITHKTSRNNTWYIMMLIYKRGITFSTHLKTEDKKGYRFISCTSEKFVFIHSGHFFSRYNERYIGESSLKNTWIQFFVTHPVPVYMHIKYMDAIITSKLLTIFNDGVGLSKKIEKHEIMEIGTFVSYDMLKKDQLKMVFEIIAHMKALIDNCSNSKPDQILKRDFIRLRYSVFKNIRPLLAKYGYDLDKEEDLHRILSEIL